MNIPFSLPVIDADVIAEMNDTLTNTGWLTSGPKVVAFGTGITEQMIIFENATQRI